MANNVKDLDQLIKRGKAEGWTIVKTNRGHWKWTHPMLKVPVFTSSTPSDWRMIHNHAAILDRVLRMQSQECPKQSSDVTRRKKPRATRFHHIDTSSVID